MDASLKDTLKSSEMKWQKEAERKTEARGVGYVCSEWWNREIESYWQGVQGSWAFFFCILKFLLAYINYT